MTLTSIDLINSDVLNICTDFLTLLRMISGARYSGVPQRVHVLPFTLFANPKSVTYMYKNITRSLESPTNIIVVFCFNFT